MAITRRRFLGSAAGAVWSLAPPPWAAAPGPGWLVLDLGKRCSLRESVAGYQSALAGMRAAPRYGVVIVPAALEMLPPAIRTIVSCLHTGGTVLLESGAAYADAPEFHDHRDVLWNRLQVRIEEPVQLWPRAVPYVDYTWPCAATPRDFSRVVPIGEQPGDIIGWVDGLPIALKRPSGRGTLIVLGSPLGPALWAGDVDARRWLACVLFQSDTPWRSRSRHLDVTEPSPGKRAEA